MYVYVCVFFSGGSGGGGLRLGTAYNTVFFREEKRGKAYSENFACVPTVHVNLGQFHICFDMYKKCKVISFFLKVLCNPLSSLQYSYRPQTSFAAKSCGFWG